MLRKKRQLEKRATTANEAKAEGQVARTFAKLMMEGKVKAALRILAQDSSGDVLPMSNKVLEALKKKHPARKPAVPSAVIDPNCPSQDPSHFILFDQLDGQMIRETALVALDKHPGIRPFGIGETARCIIGRAILGTAFRKLLDLFNYVLDKKPVVKQQCMLYDKCLNLLKQ